MTEVAKSPEPRLTIKFKDTEKELFMSYQRLNSCLRILGSPDNVAVMLIDPDLCEQLLGTLLSPKANDFIELDEMDVSTEDYDRIVIWAQEHMTDFLLKRFQQIGQTAAALEPKAKDLLSQHLGSLASNSNAPSVGPSELTPAA